MYSLSLAHLYNIKKNTLLEICSSLTDITKLNLHHTRTNDDVVETVAKYMPALEWLDLSFCTITDKGVIYLVPGQCNGFSHGSPNLISLDLQSIEGITIIGVEALLKGLPQLDYLRHSLVCDAVTSIVSKSGPEEISFGLTNMYYDHYEICSLDHPGFTLSELFVSLSAACSNVTVLNVSLQQMSDEGVGLALTQFGSLTDVTLSSINSFKVTVLPLLKELGHQLNSLYLNDVNGVAFRDFFKYCKHLSELSIQLEPRNHIDVQWFPLGYDCNHILSVLHFLSIKGLNDNTHNTNEQVAAEYWMRALLSSPLLETVHLEHVTALTDHSLLSLMMPPPADGDDNQGVSFRHLETLICNDCPQISGEPFIDLVTTAQTNIKTLHIFNCWHVHKKDYNKITQFIKKNNYNLTVLYC